MNLELPYRISSSVSIRQERFGALSYNQLSRRLIMIQSERIAGLLVTLDSFDSLGDALAAHGITENDSTSLAALQQLEDSQVICVSVG